MHSVEAEKVQERCLCRLSPVVSGAVYVAYDVLVIEVIPRDGEEQRKYLSSKNWPNSWRGSVIGRIGLSFIGIAFLAAVLVQLEQFFTKSLHNTIRRSYPYMNRVHSPAPHFDSRPSDVSWRAGQRGMQEKHPNKYMAHPAIT